MAVVQGLVQRGARSGSRRGVGLWHTIRINSQLMVETKAYVGILTE